MAKNRVSTIFAEAQDFASGIFPFPSHKAEFCAEADKYNRIRGRVFGHTGHRKGVVCWAKEAESELSDREIRGIAFHEIGHIIGAKRGNLPGHGMVPVGEKTPQEAQDEADEIVRQVLGIPLYYNQRTIQEVAPIFTTK